MPINPKYLWKVDLYPHPDSKRSRLAKKLAIYRKQERACKLALILTGVFPFKRIKPKVRKLCEV